MRIFSGLVVLLLLFASFSSAQVTLGGSKGTLRIYDAETVYPGQFYINSFYHGYFVEKDGKSAEDHTLNLAFTLGLLPTLEMFTHFIPYQDDQSNIWGPPGETSVGFKFHLPRKGKLFQTGLLAYGHFPTAQNFNVAFEPFTYDATGWVLQWLSTWDFRSGSGTLPLKMSLNVGYNDINWADRYFGDEKDKLLLGLGFKFPVRSSLLYSEFTGEIFLNNTEKVAFSENLLRFTQGFRFLAPMDLVCDMAVDVALGGAKDAESERLPYVKDYADWKVTFGLTYRTSLFNPMTAEQKVEKEKKKVEQNKQDTIRGKREQAIKELEEMRKKIEKERTVEDP